jgi:hypothetical protein
MTEKAKQDMIADEQEQVDESIKVFILKTHLVFAVINGANHYPVFTIYIYSLPMIETQQNSLLIMEVLISRLTQKWYILVKLLYV